MEKYVCTICGTYLDEEWVCPVCGVPQSDFELTK